MITGHCSVSLRRYSSLKDCQGRMESDMYFFGRLQADWSMDGNRNSASYGIAIQNVTSLHGRQISAASSDQPFGAKETSRPCCRLNREMVSGPIFEKAGPPLGHREGCSGERSGRR